MRMWIVLDNLEILILILENCWRTPFDNELGERARLTSELLPDLFEVVKIEMAITTAEDQVTDL